MTVSKVEPSSEQSNPKHFADAVVRNIMFRTKGDVVPGCEEAVETALRDAYMCGVNNAQAAMRLACGMRD